jgi:hypothetical protein
VGKSPRDPQGAPLSTRRRPGSPQRAKARRSSPRAASGATFDQVPRGEDRGVEHRAAALVDDPQPAHLVPITEFDMFFCVHLPGVVGRGRPPGLGPRSPPRRRRGEVSPHEPPSERAGRGDRPPRGLVEQLHTDPFGPPGGVLATEVEGGTHDVGRGGAGGPVARARWDARRAVATKPLDQAIDRGPRDAERRGDPGGLLPPLPEPEDGLTDRYRERARHGRTSR